MSYLTIFLLAGRHLNSFPTGQSCFWTTHSSTRIQVLVVNASFLAKLDVHACVHLAIWETKLSSNFLQYWYCLTEHAVLEVVHCLPVAARRSVKNGSVLLLDVLVVVSDNTQLLINVCVPFAYIYFFSVSSKSKLSQDLPH